MVKQFNELGSGPQIFAMALEEDVSKLDNNIFELDEAPYSSLDDNNSSLLDED